jgi:hypothetical protein
MSLKEDLMQLIFKYGLDAIKSTLDESHAAVIERAMTFIPQPEPEPEPEPSINVIVQPEESPSVCLPAVLGCEPLTKGKNDKKKAQREAERMKREANAAEGIFPEQLLTEDNLRKWYGAKHSNAYIAREFVGCREEEVAKAIKKFNIK